MKKLSIVLFTIILLLPLVAFAASCNTEKISISSIEFESKDDNVTELSSATVSGKTINLNLSMKTPGDFVSYLVTITNDSDEDYEFDSNSIYTDLDFISYTFESNDNSNIVKANSSKTVRLRVEYKNQIPDGSFTNNTYNINRTITFNLSSGDIINVPDTNNFSIYMIIITLLLVISLAIIFRKRKFAKYMILIIGVAIIIPLKAYSVCKCELTINSNIEVNKDPFTGTIYRYDNLILKNGTDISSGYFYINNSFSYEKPFYNNLEECETHLQHNSYVEDNCVKMQGTLFQEDGLYTDLDLFVSETGRYRYIKNEIENDIIKSSYVCFIDGSDHYCMKGGDNGSSFEENTQIIRDYSSRHSYCTFSSQNQDENASCYGSYGMYHSASVLGEISSYYIFDYGCEIDKEGYSKCIKY